MMAKMYNMKGEQIKEVALPSLVFEIPTNEKMLHEVIVAYEANRRQKLAHVKTRADVSGGGKKPWKQKGTGRARHGSIRSPLWVGGGVTFGPNPNRNFKKKINKKVAKKALGMLLSDRAVSGGITLIDTFTLAEQKTSLCAQLIQSLGMKSARRVLFVTAQPNSELLRCTKNIENSEVAVASDLNAYDVLRTPVLCIEESAIQELEKRLS